MSEVSKRTWIRNYKLDSNNKNKSEFVPVKKEKKTGENKYQWIPLFMVIFGFGFGGIINYLFGISYPDACKIAAGLLVICFFLFYGIKFIFSFFKTKDSIILMFGIYLILMIGSFFTPYASWLPIVLTLIFLIIIRVQAVNYSQISNLIGKDGKKKLYKLCPYCQEKLMLSETKCTKCGKDLEENNE